MKKILKKLTALTLSLVMMLGCIPSFINEVSAEPEEITIVNVLETVEEGFPTTLANAWMNESGDKVIFNNSSLEFYQSGSESSSFTLEGTTSLNDYSTSYFIQIISFIMKDKKLETISVTGKGLCTGTYKPVSKPISNVDLTSTGVLTPNMNTLTYQVEQDAPYTIYNPDTWYTTDTIDIPDLLEEVDKEVYKELIITPKSGYKFENVPVIAFNADGEILDDREKISDGKLKVIIKKTIEPGTISINYNHPITTYSSLNDFEVTQVGGDDVDFESLPMFNETHIESDLGYYIIETDVIFNGEGKRDGVGFVQLNGEFINKVEQDQLNNFSNGNKHYAFINTMDSKYIIKIIERVDLRKQANMTCPITAGTKVGDINQSILDSFTTTASTTTGEVKGVKVADYTNGFNNPVELTDVESTLENNKEYLVVINIKDAEAPVYSSIKINNTALTYFEFDDTDPELANNHYSMPRNDRLFVCYKFVAKQSSGSKKYKANDNKDSAEKISGSGKKGSKRTITPIEGKKVSSVVVTDKDGNKIDVTLNEDGTYSFIQPASNVDVQVTYKNREIKLTIGSTEASVDGETSNLDVAPILRNDRTMLPIRFVAENLGAKVGWNEKNPNIVTISRGDIEITIHLGSDKAYVNGKEYLLDSVAFAENDRTYMPVRFISEALNAIVEWNEEKPNEVKIYEQ